MSLKLYKISQAANSGYDTYDSAVVVAESERAARRIHPDGTKWNEDLGEWGTAVGIGSWGWCAPEHVKVEFVGIPDERFHAGDVVCASFNAG